MESDAPSRPGPSAGDPPPFRWGYFLWLNVMSAAIAAGIFLFVYHADFLDASASATAHWFFEHSGVSSIMAATPMGVMVLISVHYAQKGMRKRRAAITSLEARQKRASESSS
jgi:hypothetical protein